MPLRHGLQVSSSYKVPADISCWVSLLRRFELPGPSNLHTRITERVIEVRTHMVQSMTLQLNQ